MCLHGFSQSGHEHAESNSSAEAGNSETRRVYKSLLDLLGHLAGEQFRHEHRARRHDRLDAPPTRPRSETSVSMNTRYGLARDPWTEAVTWPARPPC